MAYGARLESVLGASPRGFESLSLRHIKDPALCRIFNMVERIRTRTSETSGFDNQSHAQELAPSMAAGYMK